MWECEHCGTYAIPGDVAACPNCGKARDEPAAEQPAVKPTRPTADKPAEEEKTDA